eukprot:GAFH01003538.1.p1 GENE.GAFH01003538.1~~GAFH01003538.1.p1  ORF type:complete len:221 (+),score=1.04 GAFH01003538.1:3-665(+)
MDEHPLSSNSHQPLLDVLNNRKFDYIADGVKFHVLKCIEAHYCIPDKYRGPNPVSSTFHLGQMFLLRIYEAHPQHLAPSRQPFELIDDDGQVVIRAFYVGLSQSRTEQLDCRLGGLTLRITKVVDVPQGSEAEADRVYLCQTDSGAASPSATDLPGRSSLLARLAPSLHHNGIAPLTVGIVLVSPSDHPESAPPSELPPDTVSLPDPDLGCGSYFDGNRS